MVNTGYYKIMPIKETDPAGQFTNLVLTHEFLKGCKVWVDRTNYVVVSDLEGRGIPIIIRAFDHRLNNKYINRREINGGSDLSFDNLVFIGINDEVFIEEGIEYG